MLRGKVHYKKDPPTRAIVKLRKLDEDLRGAILETLKQLAADMEAYAKANAPWQDRTGLARSSLKGYYGAYGSAKGKTYYAALKHGDNVYYGIYLEVRWGGRWGIVWRVHEVYKGKVGAMLRANLAATVRAAVG